MVPPSAHAACPHPPPLPAKATPPRPAVAPSIATDANKIPMRCTLRLCVRRSLRVIASSLSVGDIWRQIQPNGHARAGGARSHALLSQHNQRVSRRESHPCGTLRAMTDDEVLGAAEAEGFRALLATGWRDGVRWVRARRRR